ncbi:hypothetical protein [Nocardioides caldifontis]|uniref:hypothetical protein n=1 Tax=Nocardioides caldifontis TaxID=2588938 RepID=UPI0011DFF173|nr:hypothetical protein [Nocardioides caldifontis]
MVLGTLLLCPPASAQVSTLDLDCKESPTPDMPGQGLAGFFGPAPDELPPFEDPFEEGASTSIYEQYGYAGLRWHNYDLGCGPDAARSPDAIIGTSISNWIMNAPVAMASMTASLTDVAFAPDFLDTFDPLLTDVSSALHESLFSRWAPAIVALLGVVLLIRARGMALATATAAVAWALFVVVVATALFRWPLEAGHFADDTVTSTLGTVVNGLNGDSEAAPSTAVASNIQESVLYTAWLAGELGSADSETAQKWGPELFKAQTLSWREADIVRSDPEKGKAIIEAKQERFGEVAEQIREDDPTAYEYLTGARSDTRVAYSVLAALATLFALPFLLVSALLLLGSFFVVRLAVMLFPAFATLGLFPSARGIVLGIGRTVGAALVNAVIFGTGAAVTVVVIGLILDPASGIPAWLTLVLLPLYSLIMWIALKPFRRLTSMAGWNDRAFGNAMSFGNAGPRAKRFARKAATTVAAAYTSGAAAGVAAAKAVSDDDEPPERAEARPDPIAVIPPPTPASTVTVVPALEMAAATARPTDGDAPSAPSGSPTVPRQREPFAGDEPSSAVPTPKSESVPLPPTEPEWFDGEAVYPIYRASDDDADEPAQARPEN